MNALDGVWKLAGEHNTLLEIGGIIVVVVHIGLLALSVAVLGLALWSLGRPDRQWKLSSYFAIMAAIGYLLVTWYAFK